MQWYYLDANQQQIPADESELGTLLQSGAIGADTMLWNESMSDWQSGRELFPDWFPAAEAVAEVQAPAHAPVTLKAPALAPGRQATVGLVKRPLQTGGESGAAAAPKVSGSRTQRTSGTQTQRTTSAGGRASSRRAAEGKEEGEAADLVRELASTLGGRAGWIKFVAVMAIIIGVILCLTVIGALIGWIPIWMGVGLFKMAGSVEKAAYFGRKDDLEEALSRTGFFFKLNGIFIIAYIGLVAVAYTLVFILGMAAMVGIQKSSDLPTEIPMTAPAEPPAPADPAAAPAPAEPAPAAPAPAN